MTDDRLAHLADVTPLLWPTSRTLVPGSAPRRDPGAGTVEEYLLLPSRRRPRLLAPAGRRAAAAVVRHHAEGRGRADRLRAGALALGLRAGLGTALRRERLHVVSPANAVPGDLRQHLAGLLGCDVRVGMHLGPPRANRKPVLQLVSPAGKTLAYAKVGVDRLTDGLVRAEAAALTRLAGAVTGTVQVPTLLHAGDWEGHALLVQAALPVWSSRRSLTDDRLVAAVGEIGSVDRVDGIELSAAPFWRDLRARTAGLPAGEAADRLAGLVHRVDAAAGHTRLSLGGAHGDCTPWNMACLPDRILVWDWERFRRGVPAGLDLLHHVLQRDLVTRRHEPAPAAHRLVDGAAHLLAPLGQDRRAALATATVYLADLSLRYLADRQVDAGAPLGDPRTYLLPALDRGLGLLEEEER
ncbi:hypothetical protein ACI792_01340 [Blastococcus sp. SYSU DS0669]